MKEFINKHPYITGGVIFMLCRTVVRVTEIVSVSSGTNIVIYKQSDLYDHKQDDGQDKNKVKESKEM